VGVKKGNIDVVDFRSDRVLEGTTMGIGKFRETQVHLIVWKRKNVASQNVGMPLEV
jgi:hypothetical protein